MKNRTMLSLVAVLVISTVLQGCSNSTPKGSDSSRAMSIQSGRTAEDSRGTSIIRETANTSPDISNPTAGIPSSVNNAINKDDISADDFDEEKILKQGGNKGTTTSKNGKATTSTGKTSSDSHTTSTSSKTDNSVPGQETQPRPTISLGKREDNSGFRPFQP